LGEPKNYRAIMLSSTFTDLSAHRLDFVSPIRANSRRIKPAKDA